jgi:hypothetical protein
VVWSWVEVSEAVIALLDPLSISTNATLVDKYGLRLNRSAAMLKLNAAVYQFRWQELIARECKGWQD